MHTSESPRPQTQTAAGSSNELLYVNSLKMKLSVLFGVLQMLGPDGVTVEVRFWWLFCFLHACGLVHWCLAWVWWLVSSFLLTAVVPFRCFGRCCSTCWPFVCRRMVLLAQSKDLLKWSILKVDAFEGHSSSHRLEATPVIHWCSKKDVSP